MLMLHLFIHLKLVCGERLVSFLPSSWLQGRARCLWAWEMDGSQVTLPGQLCSQSCSRRGVHCVGERASGAGLEPEYVKFHNAPDVITSARWSIKDYILKWLCFEGSKYGQRGPRKPLIPDSLLSLNWELSPALLPSMRLRLKAGEDALYTARGRGTLATWLGADGLRLLA